MGQVESAGQGGDVCSDQVEHAATAARDEARADQTADDRAVGDPVDADGALERDLPGAVAERKNNRIANVCFALGGLLIAFAVALSSFNAYQSWSAAQSSAAVSEALSDQIDKSALANSDEVSKRICRKIHPDMPTIEVDGVEYIGRVIIGSLDLELPVEATYSLSGLNIAPARYAGSVYTGDIVICGHNFASHFGPLSQVSVGDEVDFVDNYGLTWTYRVVSLDTIDGGDVEGMLAGSSNAASSSAASASSGAVNSSTSSSGTAAATSDGWNLTLFTCTLSGQARVTVRCVSID